MDFTVSQFLFGTFYKYRQKLTRKWFSSACKSSISDAWMTRTEEFMAGGFVLLRTRPHERPKKVLGGRDVIGLGLECSPLFWVRRTSGASCSQILMKLEWLRSKVIPTLKVLSVFFMGVCRRELSYHCSQRLWYPSRHIFMYSTVLYFLDPNVLCLSQRLLTWKVTFTIYPWLFPVAMTRKL